MLKALEVAGRVHQAVDVVDAQARHLAGAQQLERLVVDGIQHVGQLDADGGQVVDVEEAAVVDLLGGDAPEAQAVGLIGEQRLQAVEAARVPLVAVDRREAALQRVAHGGAARHQRVEAPLDDLLLAHALAHLLGLGVPAGRQVRGRGDDALDLEHVGVIGRMAVAQVGDDRFQQGQDGARPDREARLPVDGEERARFVRDRDLLVLQHAAVLLAQHRQQHLLVQLGLGRVPVDVEEGGEGRAAAVLQHVVPPVVVRAGDAHVVGDDVHDQPHVPLLQRGGQRVEVAVGADLRVQPRMVDDVVAVFAPRAGDQERGRVDVGDPQRVEVVDQRGCVAKVKVLV